MKKTILLIDDDRMILSSLRRGLKRMGCHVITAQKGQSALKLARTCQIDEVICDVRMPEMNGFELIVELRAYFSQHYEYYPPILAITGDYSPAIEENLLQLGIANVLHKPFGIYDLLSCLAIFRNLEQRSLSLP